MTSEELQKYRIAVFESPLVANDILSGEAREKGIAFWEYIDQYIEERITQHAPFFVEEYLYGEGEDQKAEIRYGPYRAEVAMRDKNGAVRFIVNVGLDVLLPTSDNVDAISCQVLTYALKYLLDLQDDEHDVNLPGICEKKP